MTPDSVQNFVLTGTVLFAMGSAAVDIGHLAEPQFPVKTAEITYHPSDSTFLFSREVESEFVGEWRAYLKSASGREVTVCSGSGVNRFEVGVHAVPLMLGEMFSDSPGCSSRVSDGSSYFVLFEIEDARSQKKRFYRGETFSWRSQR